MKLPSSKKYSKIGTDTNDVTFQTEYVSTIKGEYDPIPKEDLQKAYTYGKRYVPFNETDEEQLKLKTMKSIIVLGFINKSQVI